MKKMKGKVPRNTLWASGWVHTSV